MDNVVGRRLFVGGLDYEVMEDMLREKFLAAGEVENVTILRDNGRSRGYGFVTMETPEGAQEVIKEFDKSKQWGRTIMVSLAKPQRSPDERRSGPGGSSRGPSRYNGGGNGGSRGGYGGRGGSGHGDHGDDAY